MSRPATILTAKRRGTAWERVVRADLERRGYLVVRSGGSLGPADLLAVRKVALSEVLLVQCKLSGRCPPEEWNRLLDLAVHHQAVPLIALKSLLPEETATYRILYAPKVPGLPGVWEVFKP